MTKNQKQITNEYIMKATEFVMEAEKETGVKSIDRLRMIYAVSIHLHMMDLHDALQDKLNGLEASLDRLEAKP